MFNGCYRFGSPLNQINVGYDSSESGALSTGTADSQGTHQFTKNDLPAGVHIITFEATDPTGLTASDTVTLRVNTPPTAPAVSLSPDPVFATDSLIALASGSVDADNHSITYVYQWYENGIMYPSTLNSIGSSDLDVGEVWTVRVTPNGYTDGPYTEVNITVSNVISNNSNHGSGTGIFLMIRYDLYFDGSRCR